MAARNRRPILNPNFARNVRKIGGVAYNNVRTRIGSQISKRVPGLSSRPGMGNSEMQIQMARERVERLRAERSVNKKLKNEVAEASRRVIYERAKQDGRLEKLLYKIRTGTANNYERKIFEEIVARTTKEVMEQRGFSLDGE
jgi:hypothetical protein